MKFRKKPVVIEARKLTASERWSIIEWVGGNAAHNDKGVLIPTLEGVHQASFGDWIIKGIQGEFYPCKPDIFEATYEPVDHQRD
jgi:hypothetical protein